MTNSKSPKKNKSSKRVYTVKVKYTGNGVAEVLAASKSEARRLVIQDAWDTIRGGVVDIEITGDVKVKS